MRSEYESVSDEALAGEAQAGSLGAFEELVARYERRIYAFVLQSCRNPADASELTQDTFVKAFQALAQLDVGRDFAAWLFTIARRKCIDHYRATRPRTEEPLLELADAADPAELLTQREAERELWQLARRVLPDLQFQALWLRYAEDMEVTQVARVLRKTKTYVKVLLFRARQTVGRELTAAEQGRHLAQGQFPGAVEVLGAPSGTGEAPALIPGSPVSLSVGSRKGSL